MRRIYSTAIMTSDAFGCSRHTLFQTELVHRFVRDGRRDDDAVCIEPHMRGGLSLHHLDDLSANDISGADFHVGAPLQQVQDMPHHAGCKMAVVPRQEFRQIATAAMRPAGEGGHEPATNSREFARRSSKIQTGLRP
jgi:hypothetical protein